MGQTFATVLEDFCGFSSASRILRKEVDTGKCQKPQNLTRAMITSYALPICCEFAGTRPFSCCCESESFVHETDTSGWIFLSRVFPDKRHRTWSSDLSSHAKLCFKFKFSIFQSSMKTSICGQDKRFMSCR